MDVELVPLVVEPLVEPLVPLWLLRRHEPDGLVLELLELLLLLLLF